MYKRQVKEILLHHEIVEEKIVDDEVIKLFENVKIPNPRDAINKYPHELSGGQQQRVGIAIAIACKPKILIADEPTTALDVTVQSQILDLLQSMKERLGSSVLLITHDLGVIAETCDEVCVMYAGRVVERASTVDLFANPIHAYTRGLLSSIPRLDGIPKTVLSTIDGMVPSLSELNMGCRFAPRSRIEHTKEQLEQRPPFTEIKPGHWVEACPVCTTR